MARMSLLSEKFTETRKGDEADCKEIIHATIIAPVPNRAIATKVFLASFPLSSYLSWMEWFSPFSYPSPAFLPQDRKSTTDARNTRMDLFSLTLSIRPMSHQR